MKSYFPIILIIVFTLTYLFPRLINLSQNLEFRSDQGIHLIETKEMVDSHHLRLLGPTTSKSFEGRQFFTGGTYYYILAVLGIIFSWSPLSITAAIIVFEFIIYAFFINLFRKNFGYLPALVVALIISFAPYLIFHSYFIWNPHFLIPLSILFLYYRKNPYLSAFIFGLAFSFHYSALFWLIPYLIFRYKYQQLKIKNILLVFLLFIAANSPFIFFEFRHQFYNLKTMLLVFSASPESFEFTAHYFVFPLLIFIIYLLVYLSKKLHFPFYLLLLLLFLLTDKAWDFKKIGWNYPEQIKVSQEISKICPPNYNIAATLSGDTRAYDMRYLLALNRCSPETVDSYPQNKTIFLVAPSSRSPKNETVWELTSFQPFKISTEYNVADGVILYRLDK
jgi:hypothetical protein